MTIAKEAINQALNARSELCDIACSNEHQHRRTMSKAAAAYEAEFFCCIGRLREILAENPQLHQRVGIEIVEPLANAVHGLLHEERLRAVGPAAHGIEVIDLLMANSHRRAS
jgi:hypothetical protein